MRFLLFILIFFVSILSCKSRIHPELSKPFESDTTSIKVSNDDTTYSSYTSVVRQAILRLTPKMNIPVLGKGIKGFEMRVWAPMSGYDSMNLIVLKNTEGNWRYTSTHFVINQPKAEKDSIHPMLRISVSSMKTFGVEPEYNEKLFLDSLATLDLQHSPKQAEWDFGLTPDTGNNAYIFEIANESSYRMFVYVCAQRFPEETEYDKRVKRFLKLLKKHFTFEFENCRY